jgi:hypothetical protein
MKSLVRAPFPITLANIQSLPDELGEKINDIVSDICNLKEKERFLSPTSLPEKA